MVEMTFEDKINKHCNQNGQNCPAYTERRCYGHFCTAWSRKVIQAI